MLADVADVCVGGKLLQSLIVASLIPTILFDTPFFAHNVYSFLVSGNLLEYDSEEYEFTQLQCKLLSRRI